MKGHLFAPLSALVLLLPLPGWATEQLIPAGSLIQCTISEPKLSSKTAEVGDPILCQISSVGFYSRSVLPYGSYLAGRFEEYQDPGHFVGRGWMQLTFDRLVLPPDQVVPVAAKVIQAPHYPVDKQGRIHGKGHPVRDAIEWSVPLLWPVDLLNLPRRGPRPVLKTETRLTMKIMEDVSVPLSSPTATRYYPSAAVPLNPYRTPLSYTPPPAAVPAKQPLTILILRDGHERLARDYWFEGGKQVRYVGTNGVPVILPLELLDLPTTVEANQRRGVMFTLRPAAY